MPVPATDAPSIFTLHPVVDVHHRWVAVLIDANPAPAGGAAGDELVHWLADGLREQLAPLPCIFPELPPATLLHTAQALTALTPTSAATTSGPGALLRLAPDGGDGDNARLAALFTDLAALPGQRLLLCGGTAPTPWPPVLQGWAQVWDNTAPPSGEREHGPHLVLGVRSPGDFSAALVSGWNWLCGNYARRPEPGNAHSDGNRAVMLRLLAHIARDADNAIIEKTIKEDSNLSYQMLRLVNSVAFSPRMPINSFAQAITMLGRRQLQRWLQLLLYARQGSNAPNPLMPVAAWRAGLMEALAGQAGFATEMQESAFIVGMFSLLDVLLGQPLARTLPPLGLSPPVNDALLAGSGALAPLLRLVEAADAAADGAAIDLAPFLAEAGITPRQWARAQGQALPWAISVSRDF